MFAAEQKIRELKTRAAKLNIQKLKLSPIKKILKSAANMNSVISKKYGLSPEEVETRSLSDEKFRALFHFHRIAKTRQVHERCKKKKVRDKLNIGEKVLVLAERIKKTPAPGKFYKLLVQNITYFNGDEIFNEKKKNYKNK